MNIDPELRCDGWVLGSIASWFDYSAMMMRSSLIRRLSSSAESASNLVDNDAIQQLGGAKPAATSSAKLIPPSPWRSPRNDMFVPNMMMLTGATVAACCGFIHVQLNYIYQGHIFGRRRQPKDDTLKKRTGN